MADDTKAKGPKKLERHFKGVSNHRRIQILLLVAKDDGITVEGLTPLLKCDFRTVSAHTQRLVQAGLVEKRYEGRSVHHHLTPYGREFVAFIAAFSKL